MVRLLSSPLLTALDEKTRVPVVHLSIEDHVLHYALFQSPGNPDAWNDACLANDGSLVRVQVTRGGSGFVSSFQVQRVTDPAQAAQWSAWTTLPGASGLMFQDGSCAVSNMAGTLRAFAQRGTGGNTLWAWTSTDHGMTWSGPLSVATPPGGALLKGLASAGNNDVFFLYDVLGGEAIGCSFYNGSSWSAFTTWSLPTLVSGSGLAVVYTASLYRLIYSDGYTLASCTFNPVTLTWSPGPVIAASSTNTIGRVSPRLALQNNLYTLACVEYDTGTLTGAAYNYPRLRQSADLEHWSEGRILHDFSATYGVAVVDWPAPPAGSAGASSYVLSPALAHSAPLFQAGNPALSLDVSASLLSFARRERPGEPARLEVVLDNTGGIYNSLVTPVNATGNYQPLGLNATLILSEGYLTGTPPTTPAVVKVGTYHLTQIHFQRGAEVNQLRLLALDLSENLDRGARFQQIYTAQTLSYLIAEMAARAGLFSPVLPATAQMTQSVPVFVLQAGQTYRRALEALCETYGLVYFVDQDEVLQVRELSASDPIAWTYQPEVESVSFGSSDQRANHIIVSGKPPAGPFSTALTTAEAFDDIQMRMIGLERLLYHIDPKLITAAQCAQKASFLLTQEKRTQISHSVTVPLNPALQLFDCLALNDSIAPTGSGQTSTCRVRTLYARYEAEQGLNELLLELEGL